MILYKGYALQECLDSQEFTLQSNDIRDDVLLYECLVRYRFTV